MAYEAYCAACTYMSENLDCGEYWCEKKGENRKASDPKCSSFCEAYRRSDGARGNMYDNSNSSSGCYLTTIMCQILKYPDDNYYLNTLRQFRDNVMKQNPKYYPLLFMYDTIGPIISYQISIDSQRKEIANTFFNNYITKSVSAIEENKYETAINIYKAMTEELANKYHLNINLITPHRLEDIDLTTLGHARKRTIKKQSN